jgi:alcohol dehydrogenase (cytochrome c)
MRAFVGRGETDHAHLNAVRHSDCLASAQGPEAGHRLFDSQCARCHGPQGGGGELGPAITGTVAVQTDPEFSTIITSGRPGRGMPAFQLQIGDLNNLLSFLHTLGPPGRAGAPVILKTVTTIGGMNV